MTDIAPAPGRLRRLVAELLVIFVGVTAAFFVERYRSDLDQREQLRQVTDGLLAELRGNEVASKALGDSIAARLSAWRSADSKGQHAVPGFYIIPGAPYPPTPSWDEAVSSGVARLYEPSIRRDLGYYFSEFVGIQENYARRLSFIEREILPRARSGPDAFYDSSGSLIPQFATEMDLLQDYANECLRLAEMAKALRIQLEAGRWAS